MALHTVCHVEFDVTNIERSQAFYGGLFDWTFRQFGPSMVVFGLGDQHVGGLMMKESVKSGTSPSVWIQVADIDSMVAKAPSLGGGVLSEKSEVPSVGWSATLSDPDGNPVGIVQFSTE